MLGLERHLDMAISLDGRRSRKSDRVDLHSDSAKPYSALRFALQGSPSRYPRAITATRSTSSPRYNNRMSPISVQDIQRDPQAFLQRVEAGEAFIITQGGCPLAEARTLRNPAAQPRPFGLCAGHFTAPADFDHSLPDAILKAFEGAKGFCSTGLICLRDCGDEKSPSYLLVCYRGKPSRQMA
jgi:antitoxin (DNA-binding transcriptional repressor) of toxin-antitoxin stability system